jgi:hypothetical protein
LLRHNDLRDFCIIVHHWKIGTIMSLNMAASFLVYVPR